MSGGYPDFWRNSDNASLGNESEGGEKYVRISESQKNKLLEMVQDGNLSNYRGAQHAQHRRQWWEEASAILNSMPGANKTPKQWEKSYKDLQLNVRKRRSDGTEPKAKTKGGVATKTRPLSKQGFHDEMLYLMGGDSFSTDDDSLPECKSFLKGKMVTLERIARAQETMAEAHRQNADNFERLADIVTKYLDNK